ncbi:glycosyltransferase family 4 protein [Campylobacter hominis]
MKILVISNMYPSHENPYFGIFVKNIVDGLEQYGCNIELSVINKKSKYKIMKIIIYMSFILKTIKKIKSNNYDIIYVHYINHSLLPLFFCKKHISSPIVLNAHGTDVLTKSKIALIIQKIVTPIIKKANLIIVPSSFFKRIVLKKINLNENKIFIFPSGGVDLKIFHPLKNNHIVDFTFGYISRLEKDKGWDVFLDSISILKKHQYAFKAIIIGDGSEKNKMIKKMIDLKLDDIVYYLGGKPQKDLISYINKMSIFVFPTMLNESLGLVGLEAMACGVPVVGSNIGALPEYIIDGFNGRLFVAGDAEDLSKKLIFFLKLDNCNMSVYKNNASNFVSKEYSSDLVFKSLYKKMLELLNSECIK